MTNKMRKDAEQEREAWLTFYLMFQVLDQSVKELKAEGNWGKARKVVKEARARFRRISDKYWRDRYLTEVEEKYGILLSGEYVCPEVKLAAMRKDDED
jgi:signal transduction protein with GAF and PtsI domain